MTRSQLLRDLNEYLGDNIWQDIIYQSDLVDIEATEAADPTGMSDTIILTDGDRMDYDYQSRQWL